MNYNHCIYVATGEMKKIDINGNGKMPTDCFPFKREYPWNPYKIPFCKQNNVAESKKEKNSVHNENL